MDMPFAFDDKLLFNLPEGYEGIWESDESEENVRLSFLIMNAASGSISFRAASIILNGIFPIIRMM